MAQPGERTEGTSQMRLRLLKKKDLQEEKVIEEGQKGWAREGMGPPKKKISTKSITGKRLIQKGNQKTEKCLKSGKGARQQPENSEESHGKQSSCLKNPTEMTRLGNRQRKWQCRGTRRQFHVRGRGGTSFNHHTVISRGKKKALKK